MTVAANKFGDTAPKAAGRTAEGDHEKICNTISLQVKSSLGAKHLRT